MTQGFIGADPRALDELAGAMARAADQIEAARSDCTRLLTRSSWVGADAEDFRRAWSGGLSGKLTATAKVLTEASRTLRLHALEQRGASDDSSGLPPIVAGIKSTIMDAFRSLFGPGFGRSPAEVNVWWRGLSEAERAELIREHPERIGRLDGIPAVDRDAANRILLAREVAEAKAELERMKGWSPRDLVPGWVPGWVPGIGESEGDIAKRLNAVIALEEKLKSNPDLLLLGFDNGGDGKVIVAVGNPDTADNVMTMVPGVGTGMSAAVGNIERVENLQSAAEGYDRTRTTAAVLWIDYDAPDYPSEGISPSYAQRATKDLEGFLHGLRASHEGGESNNTLIGFSYGAKVVGTADREALADSGSGLPVNEIVLIGAPQVGVDHASDLSVGEEHVWVSNSVMDPIPALAALPDDLAQRAEAALGPLRGLIPDVDPVPGDGEFGGQRFSTSYYDVREAHSGYFDKGSTALLNMVKIGTGHGHEVR